MTKTLLTVVLLFTGLLGSFSFFSFQKSVIQEAALAIPVDTVYVTAKAQKGDNIVRLLERYALYSSMCNYYKFLKINKLPKNKYLFNGKEYKLPIYILNYNGKTIRSSIADDDFQKALRIQAYNDNARENGLRKDDFRKSKALWVPYSEFACPPVGEEAKDLPNPGFTVTTISESKNNKPHLGVRTFEIFGTKYQQTPLHDRRLEGKIFYVIAGHGGPDPGAQGKRSGHTLCEDEYAYDVSLRLTRILVSHGATAYMIVRDKDDGIRDDQFLACDQDEFVWGDLEIPRNHKKRLTQRTDIINELTESNEKRGLKDQTVIEIHVDSRSKQRRADVFFYYRPNSDPSKELAEKIHKNFLLRYAKVRAQRTYEGTVSSRDLHTLRETKCEKAVYVELGNIRNAYDQLRLVVPRNRELLAQWMSEAFL